MTTESDARDKLWLEYHDCWIWCKKQAIATWPLNFTLTREAAQETSHDNHDYWISRRPEKQHRKKRLAAVDVVPTEMIYRASRACSRRHWNIAVIHCRHGSVDKCVDSNRAEGLPVAAPDDRVLIPDSEPKARFGKCLRSWTINFPASFPRLRDGLFSGRQANTLRNF